jgi:hypothetical protein
MGYASLSLCGIRRPRSSARSAPRWRLARIFFALSGVPQHVTDQLQKQAVREYHDCQKKRPKIALRSVKFARDFRATTHFHWQAALYALIPIPIVWLIIYGLVALMRRIKA